tara:strand:- start:55 stop:504 length:450 start_codon:yes stop_codon:yes gene_type:complete
MKLNKKEILAIQKNRDPFLMIDEILDVIPGEKIIAKKKLNKDLWFFKVHWPGDPNMPGVLQLESMTQACAMILQTQKEFNNKIIYVSKIDKAIFRIKVTPDDDLEVKAKIISFNRGIVKCEAETYFKTKLASKAEINIVIPDLLKNFIK